MKPLIITLLFFCSTLFSFAGDQKACTDCSFSGTVTEAGTKKPLSDVVIIAKSNTLNGEQKVVTDELGQYRIPSLPAGTYSLSFEKDNYKPIEKKNLTVKKTPNKINIELTEDEEASEDHHNWLLRSDFL